MEEQSLLAHLPHQQRRERVVPLRAWSECDGCANMRIPNYEIAHLWQLNAEKRSRICYPSLSTMLVGDLESCELKTLQTNRPPEVHPDAT